MAKDKKLVFDPNLAKRLTGRLLLQTQGRGEAYYLNPADLKRYFLFRPADAFNLMRYLGLGISNANYRLLGGK